MKFLLFISVSLLFLACFEPDDRVLPYPGEITTIPDSVQSFQSWFDFESGNIMAKNRSDAWELAFETDPQGWRIMVNSGAGWFIYNTGNESFSDAALMPVSFE